jgi:hypothetical protein
MRSSLRDNIECERKAIKAPDTLGIATVPAARAQVVRPGSAAFLNEWVIQNAQGQIDHWSNENPADRARLDNRDSTNDANGRKGEEGAQRQQKPTKADGVRVAKAKITRRNSLRKQRETLRG